jgi:hypothetical protein
MILGEEEAEDRRRIRDGIGSLHNPMFESFAYPCGCAIYRYTYIPISKYLLEGRVVCHFHVLIIFLD